MDPDVLVGYELQRGSLGYLVDRGRALGLNMAALLSRVPDLDAKERPVNEYNERHTASLELPGVKFLLPSLDSC